MKAWGFCFSSGFWTRLAKQQLSQRPYVLKHAGVEPPLSLEEVFRTLVRVGGQSRASRNNPSVRFYRVTALMAGTTPTGNGRREDFRIEPASRMRNIVVSAGPHSPDALLSGIRRGLYVERLAGGRADLAPGYFTLAIESGRRIEQGTLREPVRDVLIRGDVLQTLSDIQGVGNDCHVSPEPMFCGKHGVVITGIAGPTVRLGQVEVFS